MRVPVVLKILLNLKPMTHVIHFVAIGSLWRVENVGDCAYAILCIKLALPAVIINQLMFRAEILHVLMAEHAFALMKIIQSQMKNFRFIVRYIIAILCGKTTRHILAMALPYKLPGRLEVRDRDVADGPGVLYFLIGEISL